MAYNVLARKWRPQSFDDVVYQDHVSRTLRNSLESGRISHAYLFSGSRGIGKTTMARILAKALNCIHGPTPNPCGVCENCLEIKNSSSFDVLEIDGASNRGIENIRELRENVHFAPLKSKYKVYIIDEVHMLTKEAFNALLKTLEEPPDHVVFIFATTELHRIPDTILSRCQKYYFKKIPLRVVVDHLKTIAARESYALSESVLFPIARAADGSMRDAQSLLEQVSLFAGDNRDEREALSLMGVIPIESFVEILNAVISIHPQSALAEIDNISNIGTDIPQFVSGFLDMIRSLRLSLNGISIRDLLALSPEETRIIADMAARFHDDELSGMYQILHSLYKDLKFTANERLSLEMAVLDMIALMKNPSIAEIIMKLENGDLVSAGRAERQSRSVPDGHPATPSIVQAARPVDADPPAAVAADDFDFNKSCWLPFLKDLQAKNRIFLLEKLKAAKPVFHNDSAKILYSNTADDHYFSKILDKDDIAFIKEELSKRVGRTIGVEIGVFDAAPSEIRTTAAGEIPPDDAVMIKTPELGEIEPFSPSVEKIKNLFHGTIIEKGER